ncbi:MAG: hypothetical protein LBT44_10695 [Clostridiales bacterium]|jgi:PhnB protein|nr:hypothetical protein [Clostridiales bacterium]
MSQSFDVFINFDGDCREAVNFYAKAFQSEICELMTYSDAPPGVGYTAPEADKDRIMYCSMPIFGSNTRIGE